MPEGLSESLPYIFKLLESLNIQVLSKNGYEADDIIGTLAEQAQENNLISIYGRVTKVLVKKNEVVTKGQKIGSMAEKTNDGKNGTILHFELRRGTQSVNPENYFE